MSPSEFRGKIASLGLTQVRTARLMGVNPRTIRRWIKGDRAVSPAAQRLLAVWAARPELMDVRLFMKVEE